MRAILVFFAFIFSFVASADVKITGIRPAQLLDIPGDAEGNHTLKGAQTCTMKFKVPPGRVRQWSPVETLRLEKPIQPEVREGQNLAVINFERICPVKTTENGRLYNCLELKVECKIPGNVADIDVRCILGQEFGSMFLISFSGVATAASTCPATKEPLLKAVELRGPVFDTQFLSPQKSESISPVK